MRQRDLPPGWCGKSLKSGKLNFTSNKNLMFQISVPSLFYNNLHITSYKLLLTIANCRCCKLNLLQIAHVANKTCCIMHILQIAAVANYTCYKLQAFQIAHVAHCQVAKSCQKLPKVAKRCQNLPNVAIVAKCCQKLPKDAKSCQKFPKFSKICQNLPNVA